jgi:predicted peroxiredoxin
MEGLMAEDGRVVVGCSRGEENPDSVAVSYLTAGAALDQGRDVVLWLTSEGVRLGISGYADGIRVDQDPPVARLHQQFIEKGGRFYVCPICFNERELDDGELVENAELKGASPLMEFATPGTVTFTY